MLKLITYYSNRPIYINEEKILTMYDLEDQENPGKFKSHIFIEGGSCEQVQQNADTVYKMILRKNAGKANT